MTPAYTHNGQPISAEAFYAIACDPQRSVAVEACAGAGKTWMLVSRIVRALIERRGGPGGAASEPPAQASQILAITFTKKAAGEMRERLQAWLQEFALADEETLRRELTLRGVRGLAGDFLSENPLRPNEYLPQALSNLYRSMLLQGRDVQIRTFHGWFAALLRAAPMGLLEQLGLPFDYELLEDDAPATALVWQRFYAALLTDAERHADYAALVYAHGRHQTGKALQGVLDKRSEFALADAQGVVADSVAHFRTLFPALAASLPPEGAPADALAAPGAKNRWLERAKALGAEKNKTPQKAAEGVLAAFEESDWPATLAKLRGAFFVADEDRLTHHLLKFPAAKDAEPELQALCRAQAQHDAWQHQQAMLRLGRVLLKEFAQVKRDRGWIDMNDIEAAASVMLTDPVLSGWVQLRMDAQVAHLLVDEFQDTNPLQYHALQSWLAGYAGAGGGSGGRAPSVFIVGDPKQSIYRFRRAEPQVFLAAQRFVVDGLKGDLLSCDHTRRSSPEVIAAVNGCFAQASALEAYDGFRAHTTASLEVGEVLRLPAVPRPPKAAPAADQAEPDSAWRDSLTTPRELLDDTLRTLEARQAAAWIAQHLARHAGQGLQPKDVMVLARKRAALLPMQEALAALGLAAHIGEKTQLGDCCEVQDITALLDVLVSTGHNLSLARALRSPLFGLDDAALVRIAQASQSSGLSWFEVLQSPVLQNQEQQRQEFIGPAASLMQFKGWVDALPPHDALQAIYSAGDVLARFAQAAPAASRLGVVANLQALLAASLAHVGGRFSTPYAFVRALKRAGSGSALQAPAALDANSIRLLTIHGAKGLEAHTVLLLDTDTAQRSAASQTQLVDWPGQAKAPRKFVFVVSEKSPPECAAPLLATERAAAAREELNALYVGLTRARHTLCLSSIESAKPDPGSWWQRMLPFSSPAAAPAQALASRPATQAAGEDLDVDEFQLLALPPFTAPSSAPAQPAAAGAAEPESESESEAARIGQAMHRLLELGGIPERASANLLATLLREHRLNAEQLAQAQAMAKAIKTGQGAWAWDSSRLAWQGNEVELIWRGKLLRLDRLVQRRDPGHEQHWWVLDHKSAAYPERNAAHIEQLRSYRAAVQAAYPQAVVKAAFLSATGEVWELPPSVIPGHDPGSMGA